MLSVACLLLPFCKAPFARLHHVNHLRGSAFGRNRGLPPLEFRFHKLLQLRLVFVPVLLRPELCREVPINSVASFTSCGFRSTSRCPYSVTSRISSLKYIV
jgi:hypothetical protein